MIAVPDPEKPDSQSSPPTPLHKIENLFSVVALSLMVLLPVIEMATRVLGWNGISGSALFVQHLTLWVGFLGGMLAARSGRLLAMSSGTFLPD